MLVLHGPSNIVSESCSSGSWNYTQTARLTAALLDAYAPLMREGDRACKIASDRLDSDEQIETFLNPPRAEVVDMRTE